ncbi:hypothetical protein B0J12DRAFT_740966 [Macrophomina phaseolina]|uniref:Zn(2)-C6 fungal-type domain-containing protein n=1 Tax=Macrophomina phaseolina TaxID=35725 RepID=A0ABQ8G8C6_9PEZI|nr:hypothetical protein B0J12DRAFT_740966 [Macrophomina phaseolina]
MTSDRSQEQPSAPPKPSKIRLSCDSCQRCKIRCGQERPTCRRCLKYGITCVYSPSRRAGRPRNRKTATDTASQNQTQTRQHGQQNLPSPPQQALPSSTNDQCSPPRSEPCNDTINMATSPQPCVVTPAATIDASHSQASVHSLAPSQLSSGPVAHADSMDSRDDTFPDLTHVDPADNFCAMFTDVDGHHAPLTHQGPDVDLDFFLNPLDGMDLGPKRAYYCFPDANPAPGLDSSASSQSGGTNPLWPVPTECNCSAALLDQLAQSPIPGTHGGELSSIAAAASQSKPLLDQCYCMLCCPQCSSRFSSLLMVCEAMDRASVALDMGPLWDEQDRDYRAARTAISIDLARDDSPLRCGDYTVRGGDRRIVLRVLVTKRLADLQRIMAKLQAVVDSPPVSDPVLHKAFSELVSEFVTKLTSNINLVKVLI